MTEWGPKQGFDKHHAALLLRDSTCNHHLRMLLTWMLLLGIHLRVPVVCLRVFVTLLQCMFYCLFHLYLNILGEVGGALPPRVQGCNFLLAASRNTRDVACRAMQTALFQACVCGWQLSVCSVAVPGRSPWQQSLAAASFGQCIETH